MLKLINCCSFIIAKNEDCAWAFESYSCGEIIGLRNTSGKVVQQTVKIWQNPGDISSGIACMLDDSERIFFFGDRPDDKQMWEDGKGRDKRRDSAIACLQGAATNEQTISDILEDLGKKAPGLYCPLCQKIFSKKWNRIQHLKDHCNTVSELKKGMAIAEASTASEEAETPPERAVLTPFLVNRRPRPTFSSTNKSEDGGMPNQRQDTVSSATNELGGQPAALGHRTWKINSGSTSASDPAAAISSPITHSQPSAKKAANKRQKLPNSVSQPAALLSEPDVDISDSGSTSTSDPVAVISSPVTPSKPSAKNDKKRAKSIPQPAALTSEPDVEISADGADGLEGATGLEIAAAGSEVLVDPESDSIKL